MPSRYHISKLREAAEQSPLNRGAYILAHGKVEGDTVVVDAALQSEIDKRFPTPGMLKSGQAVKFNLSDLQPGHNRWPAGFAETALALGKVEGPMLVLDAAGLTELKKKFPPRSYLRFKLADLQSPVRKFPEGYVEFVMARGKISEDVIYLEKEDTDELRRRFPPRATPPPPTLAQLTTNFGESMVAWAKAGFTTASREEFSRRHSICQSCQFWRPNAMLGAGKCLKCGCSVFKLWLASSVCPDNPPRW